MRIPTDGILDMAEACDGVEPSVPYARQPPRRSPVLRLPDLLLLTPTPLSSTDEVHPGAVRMMLHGRSVVVLNAKTPEEVLRRNATARSDPKDVELTAVLDTLLGGAVPQKTLAFARMHLTMSRVPSIRSMVNGDGGPSPALIRLADKARQFCSAEQAEKLSTRRGSRTEDSLTGGDSRTEETCMPPLGSPELLRPNDSASHSGRKPLGGGARDAGGCSHGHGEGHGGARPGWPPGSRLE